MELQYCMKDYERIHKEKNNRMPNNYENEIYKAMLENRRGDIPETLESKATDIKTALKELFGLSKK